MTNPTDASELVFLSKKIAGGGATPGDVERRNELQRRMIQTAVQRAMRDVTPRIDAAVARRRQAQRQAKPTNRR